MLLTLALAVLIVQPTAKDQDPNEPKLDPNFAKLDPYIVKAAKPDPKDTPLQKLQKERIRERALAAATIKDAIAIGKWDPYYYGEYILQQTALWGHIAELLDTPADSLKCNQLRLDAMKEAEKYIVSRVKAGNDPPQLLHIAKASRVEAEIELLKVKEAIDKAGKK